MSLEKIISIPGMGGLFKMIAQMRNGGFVVEALADQRRFPVSSTQRIVMLEDISVYTMEGDMPLKDVFLKMKDNDKVASDVDAKAEPEELKATLKKIIPDFDPERVHASDIRKMFLWYSLLKDIISAEPEATAQEEAAVESEPPAKKKKEKEVTAEKEKPAAKTAKKEAAAKKESKPRKTAKKKTDD